jgi:hypothetical protein
MCRFSVERRKEAEMWLREMKMDYGQKIRLYNKDGKHVLSLIRCRDDTQYIDLITPDGEVQCCSPIADYWPIIMVELFPLEDWCDE